MKKAIRFIIPAVSGVVLIFGVAFWALTNYYSRCFPVNTWINGLYCTGKTIEEVNSELKRLYEASVVIITDANRTYGEITTESAGIEPDYEETLRGLLNESAQIFWTGQLENGTDMQIKPDYFSYDADKLRQALENTDLVVAEQEIPLGVSVYYSEGNYFLQDGNENRLDVDILYEALVTALECGETELSLEEIDCYGNVEDNIEDIARRDLMNRLSDFADCKLIYDMGTEQIEITQQVAFSFLEKDPSGLPLEENGEFLIDEEAVGIWVDELLAQYNTGGTTREFQSTRGDIVEVPYVKYGTEIDGDAERAYLLEALTKERTETEVHIPTYIQQGVVRGLDDIGGTYVEIDMTQQKMYYYKEGTLTLETDVVTGDVQDDMETPEGINYVYNKQRNRTLRGPGYASFVKYWMPVIGGVGIHDASWRSKFGGEIYLKNGSHGCINTPSDIMDDFYEAIEVGTPVIMFY